MQMSRKKRLFKFDIQAWRKDTKHLSPTTRGIWFEFLLEMHDADLGGVISGTYRQLCNIAGCTDVELKSALTELVQPYANNKPTAIITRDRGDKITIVNRRLKRSQSGTQNVPKAVHNCSQSGTKKSPSRPPPINNIIALTLGVSPNTKTKSAQQQINKHQRPNELSQIGSTNTVDKARRSLGLSNSSPKILALDLELAQKKKNLSELMDRLLHVGTSERKTFANVLKHLVFLVQFQGWDIAIFDKAAEWVKQAATANVSNKKGLFIAKIKQATGYRASKKLLH